MLSNLSRRTPLIVRCLLFFLFLALFSYSIKAQPTDCPSGTSRQKAVFTILDQASVFPRDVRREDFALKINGKLMAGLGLDLRRNAPIDLTILIDVSMSQVERLGVTKAAAKGLIQEILRSGRNRVSLVSFSNVVVVEEPLTTDAAQLIAALDQVQILRPHGYVSGGVVISPQRTRSPASAIGATSLWDISAQIVETNYGSVSDDSRRRAIFLLTDGEDTASEGKLDTSIAKALERKVAFHGVGVVAPYYTLNREGLKKISEQTGGTVAFPKTLGDLETSLRSFLTLLSAQYVVPFCSAGNGPFKVRIDFSNPRFEKARIAYPRIQRN